LLQYSIFRRPRRKVRLILSLDEVKSDLKFA
jgi:hypothetical protein